MAVIVRDFVSSATVLCLLASPNAELASDEPDAQSVLMLEAQNYGVEYSSVRIPTLICTCSADRATVRRTFRIYAMQRRASGEDGCHRGPGSQYIPRAA